MFIPLLDRPRRNGGFSPASLSPSLWLAASPAYCFEDAGGADPCEAGDGVYTWAPRAGSFTVQQATAADRPTYQETAGVGRVQAASDDRLVITGTGFDGLTAFSLFVAFDTPTTPGGLDTLLSLGSAGTNTLVWLRSDSGSIGVYASFGGVFAGGTTATAWPTGTRSVIGLVFDTSLGSGQLKAYLNSTEILSVNNAGALPATVGTMHLLNHPPDTSRGWPNGGSIYELVAANRAITAAERAALVTHLLG